MPSNARKYRVRLIFTSPLLGSQPQRDVAEKYLSTKAPAGEIPEDEAASLAEALDKGTTTFHHDPKTGKACLYDYQIKGFLKDQASSINYAGGIAGLKQKTTDLVFVVPRRVEIAADKAITFNERPLRAMTALGPRVALARSEQFDEDANARIEFEIHLLPSYRMTADKPEEPAPVKVEGKAKAAPKKSKAFYVHTEAILREIMDRGAYKGIGQWCNGGHGRFTYEMEMVDAGLPE